MEEPIELLRKRWKWAAAAAVAVAAVILSLYFFAWRRDTPRDTVGKVFQAIKENRLDEALSYVDPQSGLALYWNEDRQGIQTKAREALWDWRVDFDLELKETVRGDRAEVQLADGTMKLSSRSAEAKGAYPVSLRSLELVIYLEKKEGRWLITDINYDLDQLAEQLSL